MSPTVTIRSPPRRPMVAIGTLAWALAGLVLLGGVASPSAAHPPVGPRSGPALGPSSVARAGSALSGGGSTRAEVRPAPRPASTSLPTWTNLTLNSTGSPNGSIAYDPAINETVSSTMSYRDGQWVANGGPGGSAIAYDPTLYSGGIVVVDPNASVWIYHGHQWAWANTTGSGPVNPSALQIAYDAAAGYLVAIDFGDVLNYNLCNWGNYFPGDSCTGDFPVWSLSANGTWASLAEMPTIGYTPSANGGPFFYYFGPVMAYDAHAGYLVALDSGGETWTFSNDTWTNLGQDIWMNATLGNGGIEGGESFAYDPQLNGSVLFGGSCNTQSEWDEGNYGEQCALAGEGSPGEPLDGYNSTWLLSDGNWTNISTASDPTPRDSSPMAFDVAAGYLEVFGGNQDDVNSTQDANGVGPPPVSNQTWVLSDQPVVPPSPVNHVRVVATPGATDVGHPVTLTALLQGGRAPYSYAWAYSLDGAADGTQNTSGNSTTFVVRGPETGPVRLTVELTVTDAVGTYQSAATNVTIAPLPVGNFSFVAIQSVGIAEPYAATVQGGTGPYVFSWTFGNATPVTGPNASYAFATPGTQSATLTVTDAVGGNASITEFVQVAAALAVTLSVSNATPMLGQSIWFNASSTGGSGAYTYAWTGLPTPCVSVNTSSIGCLPAQSGNFSVVVNVTSGSPGSATAGTSVSVLFAFTLVVAATSTVLGGTIRIVVLSSASGLSYSYADLPTGCTSADTPSLVCTPTETGNFSVEVTATDPAGASRTESCLVSVLAPSNGSTKIVTKTVTRTVNATPALFGLPWWSWVVAGGVVETAVIAAVVRSRARRGGGSGPPRTATPPKYAPYRLDDAGWPPESDPLNDLF